MDRSEVEALLRRVENPSTYQTLTTVSLDALGELCRAWLATPPAEQASGEHVGTLRDWRRGDNVSTEAFNGAIDAAIAALSQRPVVDDPIRALLARHAELVATGNSHAYCEIAYTRQTGWMAWLTDKPLHSGPVVNPDRKVIAQGQGVTADEACANATRKTP